MKTLLVIEDEKILRDLIAITLQEQPLQLRMASNGKEGLESLRRQPPDAVILNIHMPLMNGADVLAGMLHDRQLARIPVLINSALPEDAEDSVLIRTRYGPRMGLRWLPRPHEPDDLVREVTRLMETPPSPTSGEPARFPALHAFSFA